MDVMHITIPGAPCGKARHRTTRAGIQYTPKETVNYQALVKQTFQAAYPDWIPTNAAVEMTFTAIMEIPKSVSEKKRLGMMTGAIRPGKAPDWDNIGKVICDPLNKILYRDDRQVVNGHVKKYYGEKPRVEVDIEVLA